MMLQIPIPYPPGTEPPPPNGFERFAEFLVLYFLLLSLIEFVLPRPWFRWCVRVLFPFLPRRLEEKAHD